MKILIEVPHTGLFPWQFVNAFPLMVTQSLAKGMEVHQEFRGNSLIYDARNTAVKLMLENGMDAILFLDSDMEPPADMLVRLAAHDKPIVSALAFRRVPAFEPCIFKAVDETAHIYHDYPKGLIRVEGVGMACCLIKREVFETIPGPWFWPGKFGEDIGFCIKARQAGIPIHCDTTMICGHVGSMSVGEAHYLTYRKSEQEAVKR